MCFSCRLAATAIACVVALANCPLGAADQPPVDHTNVELSNAHSVSTAVNAADFVISDSTTLVTSATIWLNDVDNSDDGTLNHFSGNLSWAIYDDGTGEPGTLIRSGNGVDIVQVDTGLQSSFGDAIQVHFDLDRPIALDPGTYWLALHENDWGSAYDSTSVYWHHATSLSGSSLHTSSSLDPPGPWTTPGPIDLAFALYGGPMVWNQNDFSTDNAWNISSFVTASDFTLSETGTISAIELWIWTIQDADFSGTLSWAIYTNDAGVPGSLLASGTDPSTRVVATGVTVPPPYSSYTMRQVRASMRTSLTLAAGTYWLVLHEGAWGSATDGTATLWAWASSNVGNATILDTNEALPGAWDGGGGTDAAFILYNEQLFASGFEPATTCAWSTAGLCP